jgi:CRISPR system Cascade subunit CasB
MNKPVERARGPEERFAAFLRRLDESGDRGALAALRRGLGRPHDPNVLRLVVPHLPQGEKQAWKHEAYYLTASLFALHPERGGSGNMGDVFRQMGDNESSEKRFVALLDSHPEDLPHRLRQAVSLAKSKGVAIDWLRLLNDLIWWRSESHSVQSAWARSHWGHRAGADANETEPVADTGA